MLKQSQNPLPQPVMRPRQDMILTLQETKLGADYLSCVPPETGAEFLALLSDNALLSLPYLFEF